MRFAIIHIRIADASWTTRAEESDVGHILHELDKLGIGGQAIFTEPAKDRLNATQEAIRAKRYATAFTNQGSQHEENRT